MPSKIYLPRNKNWEHFFARFYYSTKSRNVLIQGRYIFKNRILRKQFCASTYSFLLRQQVMQLHTLFWRHIHRIFNEAMHQNTLVEELCTTVQVIKAVWNIRADKNVKRKILTKHTIMSLKCHSRWLFNEIFPHTLVTTLVSE